VSKILKGQETKKKNVFSKKGLSVSVHKGGGNTVFDLTRPARQKRRGENPAPAIKGTYEPTSTKTGSPWSEG